MFAIIVYFFAVPGGPGFGLIVMDRAKNNDFNSGIKMQKAVGKENIVIRELVMNHLHIAEMLLAFLSVVLGIEQGFIIN